MNKYLKKKTKKKQNKTKKHPRGVTCSIYSARVWILYIVWYYWLYNGVSDSLKSMIFAIWPPSKGRDANFVLHLYRECCILEHVHRCSDVDRTKQRIHRDLLVLPVPAQCLVHILRVWEVTGSCSRVASWYVTSKIRITNLANQIPWIRSKYGNFNS